MTRRPVPLLFVALACLTALPVAAQEQPSTDPPAHVSLVEGTALLERDGQTDRDINSMPLLAGDRLRTEEGRVEVLFADGSVLHMDARTIVDFQSDEVVRLLDGRIRLSIAGPPRDIGYRVDAPSAWVQIADPGEYRVAVTRSDVELAVLRGSAELVNEAGRSYISAGQRTFARAGAAPSGAYVFNSAAWDGFDRWSESRRDRRMGASTEYLPPDVRPYAAAFDTYGSWRQEPEYGYVWYPRVQAGWRPYHRGRWVSLRPYGWTWVGGDPWGWPTHHYGRWGISGGSWFWIPGRTWGPAWVSWAYASDYVSWCPLGWNDRPVLQILNVNYYGGRRYSPWDAWTVVPGRHFRGSYFNVASASSIRIDRRIHDSFVVRDRAPDTRYAVSRSVAPIRSAGRNGAPRATASGPDGAAGRVGPDAGTRGFPPAARRPGTRIDPPASGDRADGARRAAPRASGGMSEVPGATRAATPGGVTSGSNARTSERSTVRERRPSSDLSAPPVTEAPRGAVRAVPRTRGSGAGPGEGPDASGDRTAPGSGRTWRAGPESAAPSASSPSDGPRSYRTTPGRAPEPGTDSGRRAIPRGAPQAAPGESPTTRQAPPPTGGDTPSYRRSAPERRAAPPDREYRSAPEQRSAPSREYRAAPEPRSAPPREYRSAPEQRSAPSREYRAAPEPRSAPSREYRAAPERRAPSGPPPSAAPAPSPSGGDRGSAGGARRRDGGSESGGQGQSGGQGRRRR